MQQLTQQQIANLQPGATVLTKNVVRGWVEAVVLEVVPGKLSNRVYVRVEHAFGVELSDVVKA